MLYPPPKAGQETTSVVDRLACAAHGHAWPPLHHLTFPDLIKPCAVCGLSYEVWEASDECDLEPAPSFGEFLRISNKKAEAHLPSSWMETIVESPSRVVADPYYIDDNRWANREPPPNGHPHHIVSNTCEGNLSVLPHAAVLMDSAQEHTPQELRDKYTGCRYFVRAEKLGLDLWHRDGRRFWLRTGVIPFGVTPEMVASACYALEVDGHGIVSEDLRTVVYKSHKAHWSARQVV